MADADLVLVNTPLAPAGSAPARAGALYPPLATLVLGSALAARGHRVEVLDPTPGAGDGAPAGRDPTRAIGAVAAEIARRRPAVVGVTTMGAVEGGFAVALAAALADVLPDAPVVVGGSWATGAAAAVLARWPRIDAVALGPAENALAAGLAAGLGRRGRDVAALADVPGWALRDRRGGVRRTGHGVPVGPGGSTALDLSLLERPERYDTMVYLTSRGCPFRCAFCTEPYMAQGPFDEPAAKVAADLAAVDALPAVGYLWLCDPLFGASRRRLDEVLPILARSRLSFLFESRVDTLDPASLPDIRAAGGDLVYLGLEAVSTRSLRRIDKVPTAAAAARYRERARAVVEACAANDVLPVVGVLEPVPGAQPDDLAEALDFLADLDRLAAAAAQRAGSDVRPFFHAFPYRVDPGTTAARRLARDAARDGTTCSAPAGSLLGEREVLDASATVDRDAARRFRDAVRSLSRPGPAALARALRSLPRPFLADRWVADATAGDDTAATGGPP
jgi:hypothetical protein